VRSSRTVIYGLRGGVFLYRFPRQKRQRLSEWHMINITGGSPGFWVPVGWYKCCRPVSAGKCKDPAPDTGWQEACNPQNACGKKFAPPEQPPKGNPGPGDPCWYPNSPVWLDPSYWEKQCVCQCAGHSPWMDCLRGCLRCGWRNGAPAVVPVELWCKSQCGTPTLAEKDRLACCLGNPPAKGGCRGTWPFVTAPLDPPADSFCMSIKIP
jgi:hypothetical protein